MIQALVLHPKTKGSMDAVPFAPSGTAPPKGSTEAAAYVVLFDECIDNEDFGMELLQIVSGGQSMLVCKYSEIYFQKKSLHFVSNLIGCYCFEMCSC